MRLRISMYSFVLLASLALAGCGDTRGRLPTTVEDLTTVDESFRSWRLGQTLDLNTPAASSVLVEMAVRRQWKNAHSTSPNMV